jgi:hypothetical protein
MLPNRLPQEFESSKGERIAMAYDMDENLVNIHTTAQDLDPWYVSPDADDEYARDYVDAHGFSPDWREIDTDRFHDFTVNDQDGGYYR